MINREPLQRAIDGATTPVYPTSFSDISAGFKQRYGARGWTSQLAQFISGSSDKKSHEYKAALRNVQRYEKGTHSPDRARANVKQALASAGKTLDPIRRELPGGKGLTLTITFTAPEDKGHAQRERSFTVTMDATTAAEFVAAPDYDFLFDEWFDGGADAYGDDGDYEAENVQVSAA